MDGMQREFELALVARLKAADAEAFDVVHAAFNTRLFNFLARLARRRDVADDLLEEPWLRFVDVLPRLHDEMKPAEAAAVCGISPEAMRQRISRARAMLTRHFDQSDAAVTLSLKAITT